MENEKTQILAIKHLVNASIKTFFLNSPVLEQKFVDVKLQKIINFINNEKIDKAKEAIKALKCGLLFEKLLLSLSTVFSVLSKTTLDRLPATSEVLSSLYLEDGYREFIIQTETAIDYAVFKKFLDLAEEYNNIPGAAYITLIAFMNFFKSLENKEPFAIKKLREDLEYVFLIQMYLNGSKELPERKTDNFNYALLSEFLKKDDLMVLKSLENYLDNAENKALGAAGAVAQSIEKEDLEPGVKKIKKDVERIEKLED